MADNKTMEEDGGAMMQVVEQQQREAMMVQVQIPLEWGVLVFENTKSPHRCASSRLVANKHCFWAMAPQSSISKKYDLQV